MPSLSLTLAGANGRAHDWNDVLTPFNQVTTLLNTTGIDYVNIQDNGIISSKIRSHASVLDRRGKVRNATGGTLSAGDIVSFAGTYSDGTDNYPLVVKADSAAPGSWIAAEGIIEAGVANNADGIVARDYEISGINTSAQTLHDPVYLSATAGAYTYTPPASGNIIQIIGKVSNVSASDGRIVFSFPGIVIPYSFLNQIDNVTRDVALTSDVTIYDDQNNADTSLTMGTSAAESLSIQVLNGSSNKTAEEVKFVTATASGTANHGKMTFNVDGTDIGSIDDGGIDLVSGKTFSINGTDLPTPDTAVTFDGSTANGVCTFKDANEATVESNLTFNGSVLAVTGSVTATTFTGNIDAVDGDFDGTLEADAITLNGTALGSLYSPIAGSSSIATVGTIGTGTWQGTPIAASYVATLNQNTTGTAAGLSATLAVASGGTGATSLTDKAVLISQDTGTDAVGSVALTSSGQIIIGGSSGPAAATLTAGSNITITNGDGAITIAAAGDAVPTTITVADTTDTSSYVALFESATGNLAPKTDAGITYNAGTGMLTATGFTGPLTGNASTATLATLATTVTITDNESTNETNAIIFTAGGDVDGGDLGLESDGNLTYNPSSGLLSATAVTATGAVSTGALTSTGNISFDGGSFVFNEAGADKDFRIEGDSNANLFVADASTDRIGIGVAAPTSRLHVQNSGTSAYALEIDAYDGSTLFGVWEDSDGTGQVYLRDAAGDPKVLLDSGGSSYFTGGNVGIGTTAPASEYIASGAYLTIEGTSAGINFHESDGSGYRWEWGAYSDVFSLAQNATEVLRITAGRDLQMGAGNAITSASGNDLNLTVPVNRDIILGDTAEIARFRGSGNAVSIGTNGVGGDLTLYGENSGKYATWDASADTGVGCLLLTDATRLTFGDGGDVDMYYDGSDFYFNARVVGTGNIVTKGILFTGSETANANMSDGGITIQQGASDDEALAFKSSTDVAHGVTDFAETDTYGSFRKAHSTEGGLEIRGLSEGTYGMYLQAFLTTDDTSDTASSLGCFRLRANKANSQTIQAIGATGNMLSIDNVSSTKFLLKGNGDLHITNTTLTALDNEDDVGLVRAMQRESSNGMGMAMSKWDSEMTANGEDLKRVGALSSEGDFRIVQRYQDVLGGAIWQTHTRQCELEEKLGTMQLQLNEANDKLARLEMN